VCLVFIFAIIGSLLRLSRRDFDLFPVFAPLDFSGTAPNFFVCAGTPFIAFFSKDVVSITSYAKTTIGAAIGLSLYEVVQIYLPRRTFDPYDIVASFLGAIVSILLARILFFGGRGNEHPIA